MKLMPIKQAQAKLANAMADKGLRELSLTTYKKDRSITLRREADGWMLLEEGFQSARTSIAPDAQGKRLVKEAFKREFPRSTRAYVAEAR